MLENEKVKRKLSFKKENLATWGEDEVNSNDEEALFCLMAFNDEVTKVFDSNLSCSSDDNDDDIDYLYHELYDSLVRVKKDLKLKTIENESFLEKLNLWKRKIMT